MATSIPRSDQYEGDDMKNLREAIDRPSIQDMAPRAGVVTAVVLATVVVGVGFVVYKRRQRRTLLKRLQDALPEMDDVRASLKRPLQRAVKVL
jgi:hypothetical protein